MAVFIFVASFSSPVLAFVFLCISFLVPDFTVGHRGISELLFNDEIMRIILRTFFLLFSLRMIFPVHSFLFSNCGWISNELDLE